MPRHGLGTGEPPSAVRMLRALCCDAMLRHGLGKGPARIDPVAVDRDVGLGALEAVQRHPLDGIGTRRAGQLAATSPSSPIASPSAASGDLLACWLSA